MLVRPGRQLWVPPSLMSSSLVCIQNEPRMCYLVLCGAISSSFEKDKREREKRLESEKEKYDVIHVPLTMTDLALTRLFCLLTSCEVYLLLLVVINDSWDYWWWLDSPSAGDQQLPQRQEERRIEHGVGVGSRCLLKATLFSSIHGLAETDTTDAGWRVERVYALYCFTLLVCRTLSSLPPLPVREERTIQGYSTLTRYLFHSPTSASLDWL